MYAWLQRSEPVTYTQLFFFQCGSNCPRLYIQPTKIYCILRDTFEAVLALLLNCKAEDPQVTMRQNGTMVTVKQQCSKCKGFIWNSQSYMPHGKYPAGNMLLSLAVLMAGASISKVLQLFRHLGLCCYSPCAFFSHIAQNAWTSLIIHNR